MKRLFTQPRATLMLLVWSLVGAVVMPFSPGSVVGRGQKPAYQPSGSEGSLSGLIEFGGARPARERLDMSADSKCPISGDSQDLIVTRGKLANVFVYLKGKSIDGYAFETPGTPAILDQGGCQFAPRVLGIQVGQVLKVLNSDITTHNVHPVPRLNAEWNTSAPPGEALEKPFKRAEVLIPIKCNQHPWMKAWVGVLEHPFFAVSDFDGSYKMSAIPPGEYQVVAWHEKLGEQTATVSIGNHEMKTINFRFRRQSASGNRVHTSGRRP